MDDRTLRLIQGFVCRVSCGEALEVGAGRYGERRCSTMAGGRGDGDFVGPGSDWTIKEADGLMRMDVRPGCARKTVRSSPSATSVRPGPTRMANIPQAPLDAAIASGALHPQLTGQDLIACPMWPLPFRLDGESDCRKALARHRALMLCGPAGRCAQRPGED